MRDQEIREALNQHWTASNSGDFARIEDHFGQSQGSKKLWKTKSGAKVS